MPGTGLDRAAKSAGRVRLCEFAGAENSAEGQ